MATAQRKYRGKYPNQVNGYSATTTKGAAQVQAAAVAATKAAAQAQPA